MDDVLKHYEELHTSQVKEYGHYDKRTLSTLMKAAETLVKSGRFEEALRLYQIVRDTFEEIGFDDIIWFCELEFCISTTLKKAGMPCYYSSRRVGQQFECCEKLIEELNSVTVKQVSNRIECIHSDMVNEFDGEHVIVLGMELLLARMHSLRGDYETCLETYERTYQTCLHTLGPTHELTVLSCLDKTKALRDLCDFQEALAMLEDFDKKAIATTESFVKAIEDSLCEKGNIAFSAGRYDDAKSHYGKVVSMNARLRRFENCRTLHAKRMTGNIHFKNGAYRIALSVLIEVFQEQNRESSKNRDILLTMGDIAEIKKEQRDYKRAMEMYNAMLQMSVCTTSDLIHIENARAIVLTKQKQINEAKESFRILMEECEKRSYSSRLSTSIQNGLAMACCEQESYDDAIEIYKEIINKRKDYLRHYHADILRVEYKLERLEQKSYNLTKTLARCEEIRDFTHAIFHPAHPDCLFIDKGIAELHETRNAYEEAFRLYCDLYDTIECFYNIDDLNISDVEAKLSAFKVKLRSVAGELLSQREQRLDELILIEQELIEPGFLEPRLITEVRRGNLAKIRYCLEIGDDVNRRDLDGFAPLHIACKNGCCRSVMLLLEFGADYEIKTWDSVLAISLTGNRLIQDIFLDVENIFENVENLDVEEIENSIRRADGIERRSAILNARNKWGYTPLYLLSREPRKTDIELDRCIRIVNLLLGNKANIKLADKEGYIALHAAVLGSNEAVLKILLDHLSDIEKPKNFLRIINGTSNVTGSTLLHLAALNNLRESVLLLLKYGAETKIKNKFGKDPMYLARDQEVKALLPTFSIKYKKKV